MYSAKHTLGGKFLNRRIEMQYKHLEIWGKTHKSIRIQGYLNIMQNSIRIISFKK